ncbi:2Fe-2S iron-sulfur cluster-binding protein [uncultured Alsobacter sp.]|uniref:2Fe-2S iron-sulfur cluster-binding protein n=1 Tax=uncultured Alsobacter sp. TaxID=1748258 RepID=UPI0025FEFE28|nr:2Fe-2S iron-sulfur cluster-binding protein [uncultured Alsobacter sp.]
MSVTTLIRTVRLSSGLVLMSFVTMHLSVLVFGLRSPEAVFAAARVLMRPWQGGVGAAVLASAMTLHLICGLIAVGARRSLAVRRGDMVQVALGLAVLPLLLPHVLAVKMAGDLAPGLSLGFGDLLAIFWQFSPASAIQQLLVVIIVWAHGAIGLVAWFSLQRWWPRLSPVVIPLLFAIPILALLGFVEGGKAVVARIASDPAFANQVNTSWALLRSVDGPLGDIRGITNLSYLAAVAVAVSVMVARVVVTRRKPVTVLYDNGLSGTGRRGLSILEISRLSSVPHASVCSGRGRCGTCRVRVTAGSDRLSAVDDIERRTLDEPKSTGAVRLACRARVLDDGVVVERLMPPDADASAARRPQDWLGKAAPAPGPASPAGKTLEGAA